MTEPIRMTCTNELHGWRRLWARLRRRPWKWVYSMDVEVTSGPSQNEDGTIGYEFRGVGPMTKETA